jgi:hypothetical protein
MIATLFAGSLKLKSKGEGDKIKPFSGWFQGFGITHCYNK